MKKNFILIMLAFLALTVIWAGETAEVKEVATPTGPQPELVLPEQRFDFGYSPEGFFLVHAFAVRNAGDEDLKIQSVRTTCGCTSAPMKKMQLVPGEETEVTVIFNSTRYKHKTSKSAIITSNDPINRSLRVTFSANMDTAGFPYVIEPRALDVPRGEDPPEEMKFTISNPTENDVELNIVDYTRDVLAEPKLKNTKLRGGSSIELQLSLLDDFDPAANYIKASITLSAFSPNKNIEVSNDKTQEGGDTTTDSTAFSQNATVFTIPVKGSGPK